MKNLVYTMLAMSLMLMGAACGGGGLDLGLEPEDDTAPTISLSGATDGAAYGVLEAGADVLALSAVAADASGIANTSISINGTLVASENSASAGYNWDVTTYDDGSYEIQVMAYDNNGNPASHTVTVEVNNDFIFIPPLDDFPLFPMPIEPIIPFDPGDFFPWL